MQQQGLIPQERVGQPCSPAFHRQIEDAVIKLRDDGAVVSMENFTRLGLANAQRYSLIQADDFASVLAFQTIFSSIFRPAVGVYTPPLPPAQGPRAWDYAVQIAAFYFAFTHPRYSTDFKRLLQPAYRKRVLVSHQKWVAAVTMTAPKPTQQPPPRVPPGLSTAQHKRDQLELLEELQRRRERGAEELKLHSKLHING